VSVKKKKEIFKKKVFKKVSDNEQIIYI